MSDFIIDKFKNDIRFKDKIAHVETIPSKKATYKKISNLNEDLENYLLKNDVKLYSHQVDTYENVKNGNNVILTTPTASGKTLAFNLPIFDSLIDDKDATALYIYPAKALANDQLEVIKNLEKELDLKLNPETYDGDTEKSRRHDIRQNSRIILTNPYQLHHILAWHHQWKRFYSNLKYIVIDEAHYYKGIFGSNVSFLIKRLKRIANFYGANPQFILSSATLANPLELANKLTGEEFKLIDKDTSPSGEKDFILYNPFKNYRRVKNNNKDSPSIHQETENIFLYLLLKDIQTLCFTVSRKIAELIAMWAKKDMKNIKNKLTDRITAYRAGYLPIERREIEDGLKTRKYLGVTCTNALELGINIGSLDAVIISGYPGTMISAWQQGGRAGRAGQKSLVILIAFENQLDQYFMNNPEFFFDKPHENAIIDTNNKILKKAQILCACKELPLTSEDALKYFDCDEKILNDLVKQKDLFKNPAGLYVYPYDDSPSFAHSLDQLSGDFFKVMNNNQLLETMERSQVYREAHEGAVLINKGETFIVNSVNLNKGYVNVSKHEIDFHTIVLKDVDIKINKKISKKKIGSLTINFGALEVSEDFYKYKKMQFSKTIGTFFLDLPPLKFRTKGLWFTIPNEVKKHLEDEYEEDDVFAGGLHGVEHALIGLFPLHVMCDRFDIGGLSTNYHEDTQEATIFIYDAYEEGIGISEKATEVFVELLKSTKSLIENCKCVDGCPSCIYSPKCGNDNKPLHKKATEYILNYMCEELSNKPKEISKSIISENEDINALSNPDLLYEEALDFINNGDYINAKDILVEIIAIDNKYSNAWAMVGNILDKQGDLKGAMTFVKKALAIDSSNEIANDLYFNIKDKI
ncbi:DEAD/DEAH box helicase [Methanobrevibacter sp. OttesenSCG-928-I08]|nr:DEAD/DEAH box helicase [Methanobrevibacter sp. OttesenSCG-928-I08]